jgi:hypothetical protein
MNEFRVECSTATGNVRAEFSSLDQVAQWINNNQSAYDFNYENVEIIGPLGDVDVFDLMRRAKAGKPLRLPGMVEFEEAVCSLMSSVRYYGSFGQNVDEAMERLQAALILLRKNAETAESASAKPPF